jgi:hypothetical protein
VEFAGGRSCRDAFTCKGGYFNIFRFSNESELEETQKSKNQL